MKLKTLLNKVNIKSYYNFDPNFNVETISQKVETKMPNGLFFCFAGQNKNGYNLLDTALKNGAKVVVVDKDIKIENTCVLLVDDIRKTISQISQNFYNTKNVKVIGITGTNGKTTTTFIVKNILESMGKTVGVIGTNGIYFKNEFLPAKLTTPDPVDLHKIFSIMQQGKVDYVVMEVSAHAIDLKKVYNVNFVCKILTNITQDHLDYFKTMTNYANTKLSFFEKSDLMIVNSDDKYCNYLINKYPQIVTFGLNNPSDTFCVEINNNCTEYVMNICDNVLNVKSNLYGLFNVYNVMAAATCCYFLGADIKSIQKGILNTTKVDGRFNVINFDNKKIIIDFAHTPDGLENVLQTAKSITQNKLFCLFGCGGNRDKQKRKIMGLVADKYADFTYLTTDNPRYEDPMSIIKGIISGFNSKNYYAIQDREKALTVAIQSLKWGDTLLVCGKGNEDYIDVKGQKIKYNDFLTINKIIKGLKCK